MALVPPKPHDIALTLIVTRLFPPREISSTDLEQWHVKNAKYLRRMLHLLARECMMASEPSGYGTLMKEVEKYMELAPNKHDKWVKGPLEELRDLVSFIPRLSSSSPRCATFERWTEGTFSLLLVVPGSRPPLFPR